MRRARRIPLCEGLAEKDRAEEAASAASAQSGPETIVVDVAATWCPSIAARAKVGFRPVRPQ